MPLTPGKDAGRLVRGVGSLRVPDLCVEAWPFPRDDDLVGPRLDRVASIVAASGSLRTLGARKAQLSAAFMAATVSAGSMTELLD